MLPRWGRSWWQGVALPTEGVDRNLFGRLSRCRPRVALPTEGVDRNFVVHSMPDVLNRRPPHGGRG